MTTTLLASAVTSYAGPELDATERRPAVQLSGLTKRFPVRRRVRDMLRGSAGASESVTAVEDVTLSIKAGELFGLLGPNGAGKTTLFKMLSSVLLPDAGTATIGGHDVVREAHVVRRALTPVLGDERSLNWRLTARENLELYAVLLEVPRQERAKRIDLLLDEIGLADTGTKLVGAFSSGMRQRLLVGRALLSRPQVLLLDEPTRSLDPVSARTLRTFLRDEIVGRRGCTVLLATHNAEEAFELCDRVAVLDHGRVLACGPARALAERYGDETHRIWTTEPGHTAFEEIARRGLATAVRVLELRDGSWGCVELAVRDGSNGAAAVLELLRLARVPVCRFERIPLSLADLLERVVAREQVMRRG
jgi:ABC-2 type transport system ATP-binding protein